MNATLPTAAPVFEPGVFYDMPAEQYHAIEAMSASGAKKMLRSPQHYKLMRDTPNEPTAVMEFGTAVHAGVLEPARYLDVVAIAPALDKRSTAGKASWTSFTAEHAGKVILSADDGARAAACIAAVRANKAAAALLEGAQVEVSVLWRDAEYGVACKARYDLLSRGGITDLKTCQDASPEGFGRQVASFLYHAQGAHYWSGHEHALDASPAFFAFIAVENEPPHAVGCYFLPPVALQAGRRLMDEALSRYRSALAAGCWPGYAEKILPLELPRWALRHDA